MQRVLQSQASSTSAGAARAASRVAQSTTEYMLLEERVGALGEQVAREVAEDGPLIDAEGTMDGLDGLDPYLRTSRPSSAGNGRCPLGKVTAR